MSAMTAGTPFSTRLIAAARRHIVPLSYTYRTYSASVTLQPPTSPTGLTKGRSAV